MLESLRSFVVRHQQEGHTVTVLTTDDPDRRHWGFSAFTRVDGEEHEYGVAISIYDYQFSLDNDFTPVERDAMPLWTSAVGRRRIAGFLLTQLPYEPAAPGSPRA